ncbi:hypothetical protein BLOT_006864 [Blomia tropicalis]|nr:hypothetical protein BLOT_006864 [Blomia tropicalis]
MGNQRNLSPIHQSTKKELTFALYENDSRVNDKLAGSDEFTEKTYKHHYVWRNIILMVMIHGLGIYGICLLPQAQLVTIYYVYCLGLLSSLGVQAGAHRLWSHRAYKANFGLRLFLSLCHVLALQNDVYEWCRDHRAHHKFADTDADPHNSTRGFFFSHVGWLLVRKHPEVKRRGRTVDLSDLESDPIVMFQRKYYIPMVLLIWGFLPPLIPCYFWNENVMVAFTGAIFTRYMFTLNLTWLVNSWAHLYGTRPYDTRTAPVEASIRDLLLGEGFHNYHHSFPWDYSASELGAWDVFNPCTACINLFYYMGWAWDLKKVSPSLVQKKIQSTGDLNMQYERGHTLKETIRGLLSMFSVLAFFLIIHFTFRTPKQVNI